MMRARTHRRGSVLAIVIWSIAILSIVVAGTQVASFRTAATGAKALERVQARWAARAGAEQAIAVLASHVESPVQDDAFSIMRDLEDYANGELATGTWTITHILDGQEFLGPMDESSKLNINTLNSSELLELDLEGLTQDVIDAIIDWRDADDEVSMMGAERDFYINRNLFYEPRNADFRSIAELECVAGVWPEDMRGPDTRLTNHFDPSAGEPGWSELLTAVTWFPPVQRSGEPRFRIDDGDEVEMAEFFGITEVQAKDLKNFASGNNVELESILAQGAQETASTSGGLSSRRTGRSSSSSSSSSSSTTPLTTEQYRAIIDQGWIGELDERRPGRLNVNTATLAALEIVFVFDPSLAEDVITLRESRTGGIPSIVDLLEAGRITPEILGAVGHRLSTEGNVFSITSRGRSVNGDIESAIFMVVDRSTLPVQILEYREE